MKQEVGDLSQNSRERLAFIEFRAYFFGEVKRSDIVERFGVQSAAATRDLAMYRMISENNIQLDQRTKTYIIGEGFTPLFNHAPDRVLSALSQGFGEGVGGSSKPLIPCEIPKPLNNPDMKILAPITRAINLHKGVRITYHSFTSGRITREIVPFALASNGLRWHVRAFDRIREKFLDFVLTRIESSEILFDSKIEEHEESANDLDWNRVVELELVPHPNQTHHEIIAMDYGITSEKGSLKVRVRAALAGYFLRQWNVDCSEDHCLTEPEIRLWLRNPLALYGVKSLEIAPGYKQR